MAKNKQPKLLRKTPDNRWIVSRDWVGWCVLGQAKDAEFDVEEILKIAEGLAPAFIGKEGQVLASISRDGNAVVTFTELENNNVVCS